MLDFALQVSYDMHEFTSSEERKMGVILGIDIGGSSTKIVGLHENGTVIDMLRVKAEDPLTSLYGALGYGN